MPTRADMFREIEKLDLTDQAPRNHDEYLARIRSTGDQLSPGPAADAVRTGGSPTDELIRRVAERARH